jgi:triosephosphate isomerase
MRKPLILGNWKMNGDMASNEALMASLLQSSEGLLASGVIDAGFAVPAPYLFQAAVRCRGRGLIWGAQDVSDQQQGAYTGEISVAMLQDFEASFALVGHSERRARGAESDAIVCAKARTLLHAGLMPVICVGESLDQRERGEAQDIVSAQVSAALACAASLEEARACVVAYEPIWAIGTGRTASAVDAQTMHVRIREVAEGLWPGLGTEIRILYGGSVNAENAEALLSQPDIDGALVGGASLKADQMSCILRAAVTSVTPQ